MSARALAWGDEQARAPTHARWLRRSCHGCVIGPERYTKGQAAIFGKMLPDELVVPLGQPVTVAIEWVGRVASTFLHTRTCSRVWPRP